jgi:hypothetical protein
VIYFDNEIKGLQKNPGHVDRIGETRNAYRILVRKTFIKGLLERSRRSSKVSVRRIFRKWAVGMEVIHCYFRWLGTERLYCQAR